MTDDEFADMYGAICNVIERNYMNLPLDELPQMLHTSKEAREATNAILEIVGYHRVSA